jgi:hypothetical protein
MNTNASVANIPYKEADDWHNKEIPRTYIHIHVDLRHNSILYRKMRNLINRPDYNNKIHQRVSWEIQSTPKQVKCVDDAFTTL